MGGETRAVNCSKVGRHRTDRTNYPCLMFLDDVPTRLGKPARPSVAGMTTKWNIEVLDTIPRARSGLLMTERGRIMIREMHPETATPKPAK